MKFTWFHLMPYRFLPDDFTEKYRSVWVDIPRNLYDAKIGHQLYNEYLDSLEFADKMGFDGLGVNEHHQNAYGLMPSPNIMAAAMTRRAANANIVVLGNSIALYNPPIRVAEEFAMLDVISGGRLVAGFPVGTSMDTNFCYGEPPATLRERYYEAHDLILKAWTTNEVFSFNGKFSKLRYVNLWPKPLQQPHPPIWIPGGGSIETWDFCGRNGYQYSYLSFFGYRHGRRVTDGYWQALDRLGKEPNPHALVLRRFSPSPRPTRKPSANTALTSITSSTDACTSGPALPRHPATAPWTASSRDFWVRSANSHQASKPRARRPGRIWWTRVSSLPDRPKPCATA